MNQDNIKPYSKAIIKLLKGVVNSDDKIWPDIINYQGEIADYITTMGLELVVREEDGFAYVKQMVFDDGSTLNLAKRQRLSFEVSLVIIVLRYILEEFDSNPTNTRSFDKFVTYSEIQDELQLFLPRTFNTKTLLRDMRSYINKVVEEGFLKEVDTSGDDPMYKIHRIIKERVTVNDLDEMKKQLEAYGQSEE